MLGEEGKRYKEIVMNTNKIKDFSGYKVFSTSSVCKTINGKIVEKTIRKAFPEDNESTLYIVKLRGIKEYQQLYEDEMYK